MLSLDGFEKAWNVLEWNLSFSISDGITLIIAAATTALAFLTYRIQKEQKNIVEQQNKIIERQVAIDEIKFEQEKELLKNKLNNAVFSIGYFYKMNSEPLEKWFDLISEYSAVLDQYLDKEVVDFVGRLRSYHLAMSEVVEVTGDNFNKEEALEKIVNDFDLLFLNFNFDSAVD
ncbi:hypothetical protein [Maridesulfovibrio sp.]|uniref:hypothetical protein n=1 Tax=Maridesulfovibrio sp. TaxID=2795000 RepID=UPI0029CA9FEF|nr:hypothetical protein [Maridesulfovibrio sp.]